MSSNVTSMTDQGSWRKPLLSRAGYGYLALFLAFASISTDLYLPAMPTMADALGTSEGTLEWTISGFLLGFALGQLFWGPFSDQRGRRVPLAMGLILFIVGSVGCGLADYVGVLIAWRVVQAVGASACVVIGRAIIADLFEGRQAARILSLLTAVMIIAPMLGPTIGAQILAVASWRVVFLVLTLIGAATLAVLFRIVPESLPDHMRSAPGRIIEPGQFAVLLRNRAFSTYALVNMCITAGVFAYVAGSAFFFITYQELSPEAFGLIFAAGALAIIIASIVNARLVPRFGTNRMLLVGIVLALLATSSLLTMVWLDASVYLMIASIVGFNGATGFISANAIAGGLSMVSEGRGRASALLGASQYGGGVIGSAVLGLISNGTMYPLAIVLVVSSIAGLILALQLRSVVDA